MTGKIIDFPMNKENEDLILEPLTIHPYAARVNLRKYREDVKRYETKLYISNTVRKALELVVWLDILAAMFLAAGIDSERFDEVLGKPFIALIIFAAIGCFLLRVPVPKLPRGIGIVDDRYVILNPDLHPGRRTVIVGHSCIFRDNRKVKVTAYRDDL